MMDMFQKLTVDNNSGKLKGIVKIVVAASSHCVVLLEALGEFDKDSDSSGGLAHRRMTEIPPLKHSGPVN